MPGPSLPFSEEMHQKKYRGEGESFRDSVNRVANALKEDALHYHNLRDVLLDMRFMPGGRVQNAVGSTRSTTPYNCFVSGRIEDSFVDGVGSIMNRAKEAAQTMRMGGGIGYDFSRLRPRGADIVKLGSRASGPVSFMEIYDAVCRTVASSGHRRGAQMGVLRVDHPDIEEFVHAKRNGERLTGFNISVGVTDEFMERVADGRPFPLRFGGRVHREIDAGSLWDTIMRSTWDWAEPGVLFLDTINRYNNLWYCETIEATNPCGEQPLPPYGACLLGSFNLVKYIYRTSSGYSFAWDVLDHDIPVVVAAMDNVVDRSIFPLFEQEQEAKNKRRMGLGVTGLANTLEAMGLPYGTSEFVEMEKKILERILVGAYEASSDLAARKGSFPMYDEDRYLEGIFIKRLPTETRSKIRRQGIRNSHLTSIAPTGTISLCADNVSSGIEPVFAYSFDRTVIDESGPRVETIEDYGVRSFGVRGKVSAEVSVAEHLDVLVAAAENVDSAVSKTCNVGPRVTWEEFKKIYSDAWERGAKGCTTFRSNGKRAGILVEKPEACYIDPVTGRKECA